ncbi:MAG: tRNA dihydrouridine synthase DusB [Dactylosporangium sp.]|nr:tRNA dihydrouridine synthase DusB [Dactylosporangium sp.]
MVLAPMAGVTNVAFRRLCREFAPGGLFTCEMVTARALIERHPKTLRMITFDRDERPRSLQLYGVDPAVVADAVRMVVDEGLADHLDLNFGCPVPKVTRRGGGAALPWRRRLFAGVVRAAVGAAAPAGVPVTVKLRLGIDDDHLTYRTAGRIAADVGAAAVTLHARTLQQGYAGPVDLPAIAELKRSLPIPVLGNGNIWEAADALRMVAATGVDGVVIGRGCLGRPWLFADLASAFAGGTGRTLPALGEVATTMLRHAGFLVEWMGDEARGCADFRKHIAWYLKGFPVGGDLRRRLAMVSSLAELGELLGALDPRVPFPEPQLGEPRGRTGASARVILPAGWLDDTECADVPDMDDPLPLVEGRSAPGTGSHERFPPM